MTSLKDAETDDNILVYREPEWLAKEFLLPYRSGLAHTFIFHGDTDGLVMNPACESNPDVPYISLREFFETIFGERRMVIFYNVASGMRFLEPEMEKNFRKLCGLDEEAPSDSDPVAAAKAKLAAKRPLPQDPNSCLPLIGKVLGKEENVAVILKSVHFIAPNPGNAGLLPPNERVVIQMLQNWSRSERMRARNNLIIMLTDDISKVSPEMRGNGSAAYQVYVPKPSKPERVDFISSSTRDARKKLELNSRLEKLQKQVAKAKSADKKNLERELREIEGNIEDVGPTVVLPVDFDIASFAHATQGMSFRQISEIFIQGIKTGDVLSLRFVKERKRSILNSEYGDLMELVDATRGFEDIGGLQYIKDFFGTVLNAIKKGEYRLVPMGVYLMGPPGTGKTAIVEATAKEAEFNFVKTRNIRSMWVGESEGRQERLIAALRSLAPVVVMNDEADLNDAQRDSPRGDSGVGERMMKMWMEFLSDPKIRGQVLVVSCTNRPDRIDAALKRSGRGDQRLLLPMPSEDELPDIYRVMFKRHNIPTDIKDFRSFAKQTAGFSGADVEAIVLTSFRFAGGQTVNIKALNQAIEDFIPSASQAAIDFMTMVGLLECSSRLLLPPNIGEIVKGIVARGLVENLDEYIAQIKARKIISI